MTADDIQESLLTSSSSSSGYGSIPRTSIIDFQQKECKSYRRRWYILIMFALFTLVQGAVWNTWGPISNTASQLYGWDNTTMALLPNWGAIFFLIAFIPMVKMLLRFGLRWTTLHCSFLMALGTGLRCIPCNITWKTILAHVCAMLTGYCSTLAMIAPTALSATWFPPNERTTATAVVTLCNSNVALGISFFLAKLMVRDINVTSTFADNNSREEYIITDRKSDALTTMEQDVNRFMFTEFGACLLLFFGILIYFPKRPPLPPSSSAIVQRMNFKSGLSEVVKNRSFWLVLLAYSFPHGFQNAFVTIMDETLSPNGISQDTSDWIGFYSALAGIPAGIGFSRLADYRKGCMKILLLIAMGSAGASYACFSLVSNGVLPHRPELFYISLVLGCFFTNAAVPLFYELACELTYPISEEVVTGFITGANNFACVILLGLFMVKQLGTMWVNLTLATAFLISVPLLVGVEEECRRSLHDMDTSTEDLSVES